jgi:putative phage-type endonuclease
MKITTLMQGTPAWHQHRATHHNASDAPAMLGVSHYVTRAELVQRVATGVVPEVDASTQQRFDAGHRAEALARPLAEKIAGEDLYPIVGVADDNPALSASFDGITIDETIGFEHKALNDALRAVLSRDGCTGADLDEAYRVQMEQQCMVSGATRVLFMASEWDASGNLVEELHCWYTPDPALRARIVAGWKQFDADVAAYVPAAEAAAPVGAAPDQMLALRVEARGMVTFSNLAEFRESAMVRLAGINRDLQTDEDFADAEQTVKWCKGVEERLDATKANVLAQMTSVDEVCRTIDSVNAETRKVRLELDRLVKSEKERRRAEIVASGVDAVRAHYNSINATLNEYALPFPGGMHAFIGQAIKGRRTLTSIRDAVDTAVAAAKIDASRDAEGIRQNIAVLAEFKDHAHLFVDRVQLCASKTPDDLRNLAAARIAEHQQREAERMEAERERIRQEEAAKVQREAEAMRVQTNGNHGGPRCADPNCWNDDPVAAPNDAPPTQIDEGQHADLSRPVLINLRAINTMIAPLSISAAGLAQLGIKPAGKERASVLYSARDVPAMKAAMIAVIREARVKSEAA